MKTFVVLVAILSIVSALTLEEAKEKFVRFQKKYNKVYSSDEFLHRFQIFRENMELAEQHQAKNPLAKFGMNEFSDLSAAEFKKFYLMDFDKQAYETIRPASKREFAAPSVEQEGGSFDWGSKGVVTPVYNQGQCGSCWAFSATETIESYFAISGGALTQLSMQQIVSCDTSGQDQGCEGGFPSGAYQYVESAGGIDSYQSYPYESGEGADPACSFPQGSTVTTVANYNSVDGETGLYQQLSSSSGGPVSVCVDASSWQSYEGGILTSCGNSVDHCVQSTGYYNYGAAEAYWNVRNSWGPSWGVSGYIQIAIGQDLCSIGDYATIVQV